MIPSPELVGLRFHHVGVACKSIARDAPLYEPLGYVAQGPVHHDPLQRIDAQFLEGGGPRLELVQPSAPGSPVASWLERRAKLYHVAYMARTFDAALDRLRTSARGKLLVGPVPAVAFGGQRIAFVILPNLVLVEVIDGADP